MPAHEHAALDACAAIVAELRAAALGLASDLAMAERRALAGLATAVGRRWAAAPAVDPGPFRAAVEIAAAPVALVSAAGSASWETSCSARRTGWAAG